jgi:hypothetical protein
VVEKMLLDRSLGCNAGAHDQQYSGGWSCVVRSGFGVVGQLRSRLYNCPVVERPWPVLFVAQSC